MKWHYRKARISPSQARLLLFFSLLASISLTPPEYLECNSLFPDEDLDFPGISRTPQNKNYTQLLSIVVPSLSIRGYSLNSALLMEIFSFPFADFPVVLPTFLRC